MASYPPSSYPWLLFRKKWCDDTRTERASKKLQRWNAWIEELTRQRYKTLPKRYRSSVHWNRLMSCLRSYHGAFLDGLFYTAPSAVQGIGIFASVSLRPGDYAVVFGECHKISHTQQARLERTGESSFWMGDRVEYMGGPLSLVNHACPPSNNAQFVKWDDDPCVGHKLIGLRLLKPLVPGEEVLVDYGEEWWRGRDEEGVMCRCQTCSVSN